MEGPSITVVILRAPNTKLKTHLSMVPKVIDVLTVIQPDHVIEVFHAEMTP